MECLGCWGYVIVIVLLYKLLDWLIRRPYVGKYNERYILVTGCDTGFGNRLAIRLDALGCNVFAGCLTESGAAELKKLCSDRLKTIIMDVSNSESVRRAHDFVKLNLPPGKGLWGLMNNAGILGAIGHAEWMTVDDYKPVAAVNLYGLIDVTMTFLPLVKMERGRIVNTSSVFGRHSLMVAIPYCMSKYGVQAFTDGLRRTLTPFKVNAILVEPGLHKTFIASHAHAKKMYENSWNKASPEAREEYGEEYFNYVANKGLLKFEDMCSDRIDDVVDAYEHGLLGYFPRARYMPGKDAKFIWMPIQWMPEWLGDKILRMTDPNQPLPVSVLKKQQ